MTIDQLMNLPVYAPPGGYDPYVFIRGVPVNPTSVYDMTLYFTFVFLFLQFAFPWALVKEKRFAKSRWVTIARNIIIAVLSYTILVVTTWLLFILFRKMGLHSPALFDRWELSLPVRLIIGILGMDFLLFFLHRCMHKIPQFWPVHRVHHIEYYVDTFSWSKTHPIEGVINALLTFLACYISGCTALELLVILNVGKFFAIYLHSDWRLPWWMEKHLGKIFMTSGHHLSHHDQDENYHHANYGLIFTFWDRVFKSHRAPEKDRRYNYGLPGYDGQKTTVWQILTLRPEKQPSQQNTTL